MRRAHFAEDQVFTTLLASSAAHLRVRNASVASVAAHVIFVGAALAASAPGSQEPPRVEPQPPIYVQPTPVDVTQKANDGGAGSPSPVAPTAPVVAPLVVPPIEVPGELPPISTLTPATAIAGSSDFAIARPGRRPGFGEPGIGGDTLSRARTEHEVDRPVQLRGGQSGPRYPELLRAAGVEGQGHMQFVVDTPELAYRDPFPVIHGNP